MRCSSPFPILVILLALVSVPELARTEDGVVEISQAGAVAGGGFPVGLTSGSYLLTSHLSTPTDTTALRVDADDVEIDLNGFTIDGGSGGCTGSGSTLSCPPGIGTAAIGGVTRARVRVRNGIIRNFRGDCIRLGDDALVEDLHVSGCAVRGIELARDGVVRESIVTSNGGVGVLGLEGLHVVDSISVRNGNHGFRAGAGSIVTGSIATGNGGRGIDTDASALIQGNVASQNELAGIDTDRRSQVLENAASSNGAAGVVGLEASRIEANATSLNGAVAPASGIDCSQRCSISGNVANGNTADGIEAGAGGLIAHNVSDSNAAHGIDCVAGISDSCSVVGNTSVDNVGNGLAFSNAGAVVGVYKNNGFSGNTGGDVSHPNLDPGFQNACSGTIPCP